MTPKIKKKVKRKAQRQKRSLSGLVDAATPFRIGASNTRWLDRYYQMIAKNREPSDHDIEVLLMKRAGLCQTLN